MCLLWFVWQICAPQKPPRMMVRAFRVFLTATLVCWLVHEKENKAGALSRAEFQQDSTHTRVNTPFPGEFPGFYGSPRGFAAVSAMLQEPHAVLSAELDQQWHFLEHLCFSWRSLLSMLTRPNVAYLQWLGQLMSAGLEGMIWKHTILHHLSDLPGSSLFMCPRHSFRYVQADRCRLSRKSPRKML